MLGREANTQQLNSKLVTLFLLLILVAFAGRARAQSSDPPFSKDKPLLEVDVRKFGYERTVKKAVRPVRILMDFTDTDHLALAWAIPEIQPVQRGAVYLGPPPAHQTFRRPRRPPP